jgi:NAD-dependent dihydropyrimidine dehydrogenase PreA subunit
VDTAEQVYLQEAGVVEPQADDSVSAFKGTGTKKEELYAEAAALRERFVIGSWIFGGWMGLVIGLKLIGMAVHRPRDDYHIDPEGCIACGRCYDLCSVEQVRLEAPDAEPDMRRILSAAYEKESAR